MTWRRSRGPGLREQRGQVAVTVSLLLLFVLVTMMGVVLDLGHLYIAKTELQNATDACALSAVRELAISRDAALVKAAGRNVGQLNKVDFQSADVIIANGEVTFSDSLNAALPWSNTIDAGTQYVRCEAHKDIHLWFMGLAGWFSWDMGAAAVGRMVPGRFNALPLCLCGTPTKPYGFQTGWWYGGRFGAGAAQQGNYGWIQFPGQEEGGAKIADILAGDGWPDLGEPNMIVGLQTGVRQGIVTQAWNTRFGLYQGQYHQGDYLTQFPPDLTGYAYTEKSWPYSAPQNAYNGTVDPDNFLNKREAFSPYNPTETGLGNLPNALPGEDHRKYGQDRRLVLAPICNCDAFGATHETPVLDYACVLLLAPIADPDEVKYEYRGLAENGTCASAGFPGGRGALVPALVQ